MSDQTRLYELEAKVAMLELQLKAEQAQAAASLAVKDQLLETERRFREDSERMNADHKHALEEAYEAQLQALKAEVELWRRDDVPGLLRWFERRLRVIDSTLAQLDGTPDLSEAMRLRLDALRAERVDIEGIQVRLGGR